MVCKDNSFTLKRNELNSDQAHGFTVSLTAFGNASDVLTFVSPASFIFYD